MREREGAAVCAQIVCSDRWRNLQREKNGGMWGIWVLCGNGSRVFISGAVGALMGSAYIDKCRG